MSKSLDFRPDAIFIDDGGVMNDNSLRSAEWRRLVGEFFSSTLGGARSKWSEANRAVFGRLEQMLITGPEGDGYSSWFERYQLRWLRGMAAFVGVSAPRSDSGCLELAWEASDYVTQRARSAYPGAAEAVRILHDRGYRLFTASGEHSRELEGYMRGMGIQDCFQTLYGCDLVNYAKYSASSVDYYRLLFDHSGINPNRSLVVDDRPQYLARAASLGASTCLVSLKPHLEAETTLTVPSLADLPNALAALE